MHGVIKSALFVIVYVSFPLLAQTDATAMSAEETVALQWDLYLEAKGQGDVDAQKVAFDRLRDEAKGSSGKIYEQAAILFLAEGNRELDLGNYDEARREFLNCAQLNPYMWPAYTGLARVKKELDHDYLYYVSLSLKGLRYAFSVKNTFFLMDVLFWLLERLLLALKWGLVCVVGLFFAKYCRSVYATTVSFLENSDWSRPVQATVTGAVFLAPWVLGLNVLVAALYYWVMVYPFLHRKEKLVSGILVANYLLSVLLLFVVHNIALARASSETRLQVAHFFQGDPRLQVDRLEAKEADGDTSNGLYFALARAYHETGDDNLALEYYEKVDKSSDYGPLAEVNKGNIYLKGHEYQRAITAYESTLRVIPKSSITLYNLSVAKSRIGEHRDAETFLRRAKQADPRLIEEIYLRGESETDTVEIEYSPLKSLTRAAFGSGIPDLVTWFKKPIAISTIVLVLLALGFAIFHERSRNPRFLGKSCNKCGNIYYVPDSPSHAWCSQCVNLYVRKDDLPSEAKLKKYEEVQRFSRLKKRFVNISQTLLPGAKAIYRGSTWSGSITAWFWVCLLVFSFSSLREIPYPFMSYVNDFMVVQVFVWGTTAFFWLIFGFRGIWRED